MAKTRIQWRTQYDPDDEQRAGELAKTYFLDESKTQQHHTDDVNLNVMVRRFGITDGALPPAALDPQYFGDFTDATDFRDALDRVRHAEHAFNALPADLRERFNHDPIKLFSFVNDPRQEDEAVRLGLLKRLDPPAPKPAEPAPPAPTPPGN